MIYDVLLKSDRLYQVEGTIKAKEFSGSGVSESIILNDSLFTWDAERHASFPTKVTFRYTLPTHYTDRQTGEQFRLPPSHDAHMNGIPGFDVSIQYAIVVNIERERSRANLWQKSARLVFVCATQPETQSLTVGTVDRQIKSAIQVPRFDTAAKTWALPPDHDQDTELSQDPV